MKKSRVDVLMVERGLADSRSQAQRLVMAGQVRIDGEVVLKSSQNVPLEAKVEVEQGPPYVSRGGEKLQAALQAFALEVSSYICADVGASTGGFTDCLLQHGAARVYAIDVGQGILHWKLRQDPRIVVMERTNARYVKLLPEPVDLVTIDASFISLKILLPIVYGWFRGERPQSPFAAAQSSNHEIPPTGIVIPLIKPQFEAGRVVAARGDGVIRDPAVHRQVLEDVLVSSQEIGYGVRGLVRSPLLGPKGNVEFLANLVYPGKPAANLGVMIEQALSSSVDLLSHE